MFTISTVFQKMPNDMNHIENDNKYNNLNSRLTEANNQIEILMQQNRQLAQHLKQLIQLKKKKEELMIYMNTKVNQLKQQNYGMAVNANPDISYEESRRRIRQNIDELWHYLQKRDSTSLQFFNELRYNMIIDFDIMEKRDNEWREQQLKSLANFVQKKIYDLQNPSDCKNTKKLVCDINKSCGFGCQMHHSAHCLVAAMALNRTLILKTDGWRTSSGNTVWNKVFKPLSDKCLDSNGYNKTFWGQNKFDSYQVITFPIIDFIDPKPQFLPLVIPQQISSQLIALSGEPFIWFIGQVLKYIMRPSERMTAYIDEFKRKNKFNHPIVGIHVRRTDKIGSEAKFHSIDEYMYYVDDYYKKLDFKNERNSIDKKVDRLVYLATDEPNVWRTEITKYKKEGYIFTGDISLSESADPSIRHGFESLHNVIVDIILLSECDYIVCTFSSQICRLAFELMQTQHSNIDLSNAFYSLDDIYYFGGQVFHGKQAIMNHKAVNENEISFKVGDILGIANNMHNGYNFGDHNKTKAQGLYPRFKVKEFVESKPFSIFGKN